MLRRILAEKGAERLRVFSGLEALETRYLKVFRAAAGCVPQGA